MAERDEQESKAQDTGAARPRDRQQREAEPESALGGGTATRSSTAEGPDPAEEQG